MERPTRQQVLDATAAAATATRPQPVAVNVYEASAAVVVLAPMPAVTADDVTVELNEGVLRFWSHVRSAGPREFLVNEWDYGGYEREIEVPPGFGRDLEAKLV